MGGKVMTLPWCCDTAVRCWGSLSAAGKTFEEATDGGARVPEVGNGKPHVAQAPILERPFSPRVLRLCISQRGGRR
jgi:hypothetical protein